MKPCPTGIKVYAGMHGHYTPTMVKKKRSQITITNFIELLFSDMLINKWTSYNPKLWPGIPTEATGVHFRMTAHV